MRTSALVTVDDLARIADVLGPCELVKGEIIPMSPGGLEHSMVSNRAAFLLESHNRTRRVGRVLTNEAGIVVARKPDTVRGADVAFISYQRLSKDAPPRGFLQQPPELVIEVFGDDASWAKMDEKIADYHGAGVDVVWVLDPRARTLHAHPRGAARVLLRESDTVSADPYMPGFACRVGEFFED
jgi:Uma2 family endonuclease